MQADRNTTSVPQQELAEPIEETLALKRAGGVFTAADCADALMDRFPLDKASLLGLAKVALTSIFQRRITRAMRAPDDRQGLLALEGYALVSPVIRVEGGMADLKEVSHGQHRESIEAFAKRIKSYGYARRSPEKLKHDKARLAQERKLNRQVAPLTAGDPEMKMGPVMELHRASLETPKARRNRRLASLGGKAKSARTKNQ